MRLFGLRSTACLAAASILLTPTIAAAATPAATSPVSINSWQALAMLSNGPAAISYCGASVAAAAGGAAASGAAQAAAPGCVLPVVDAPVAATQPPTVLSEPLPPPLPGASAGVSGAFSPLYLLLGAAAVAALIYVVASGGGGGDDDNSPS